MLTTLGQGLAMFAIVQLGFRNTHDDFDVARFFKRDEAGHEVDIDVSFELLQPAAQDPVAGDTKVPAVLCELAAGLAEVGFTVDGQFAKSTGRLRFTRLDRLKRIGQPLVTAVHVYATYRHCIGPTTI